MGFNVPRQAEGLQGPNAIPIQINFIPGKTVPRRLWLGMMIVVPAFAES